MQVETPAPCFIETTTALGISGNFLSAAVRDARYDANAYPSLPNSPIFRTLFPTYSATFFADNREDLSKLQIPSLLLQCSEDIIAPMEVGMYLQENLPGSTLKIMKAKGHCPHMSAPEETVTLIKEYLA